MENMEFFDEWDMTDLWLKLISILLKKVYVWAIRLLLYFLLSLL